MPKPASQKRKSPSQLIKEADPEVVVKALVRAAVKLNTAKAKV